MKATQHSTTILPVSAWKRVKRARTKRRFMRNLQTFSIGVLAFALGGLTGPYIPILRLETGYKFNQIKILASQGIPLRSYFSAFTKNAGQGASNSANVARNPLPAQASLQNEDGSIITPADDQFSLIVPKIGINAKVIAGVNPANPIEYNKALSNGIAHASTSYLPDEDGTVYLFSHSTNYDWFVKDINAVFYLLKNVTDGDTIIVVYKNVPYTYKITGKRVVSPSAVSYLVPERGVKRLILQTCWPPGSTSKRLLIFADLVVESADKLN